MLPKNPLRSPERHDRADSKVGAAAKGVPNLAAAQKNRCMATVDRLHCRCSSGPNGDPGLICIGMIRRKRTMRYIGKWVSGVVSRLYSGLIVGICVWLGLCGISNAQTSTATVTGTIMDAVGSGHPRCRSDFDELGYGCRERRTVSNSSGAHVLLNIPPGRYELQVSAEGFQTVKQSELTLTVNQTSDS